jgi:hypothetical protein
VPAQQAGPHVSSPAGQAQIVPFQVWRPGQVGGLGVGVGRRAASVSRSESAVPVRTAPPSASKLLNTIRRLLLVASVLVIASNR